MVESVPNVSEGRRPEVIDRLVAAVAQVEGVRLLDHSADPSHNRSVFTLAGSPAAVEQALLRLATVAIETIDLRLHRGVHPRIGALDVVPFIPLEGSTLAECVELSRRFGRTLAETFRLPVFLYEYSSSSPERRRLETIRRGEFEGLAMKMREPGWAPDFGPDLPHPTAGATVVGARMPLIAFNVNLASTDLAVAKQVAAAVRESSGGLPAVKALGLRLDHRGIVQVSMNLTDFRVTPVQTAFEAVRSAARARGVDVLESELIGLIPAAALEGTSARALQLHAFDESQILERRLASPSTSANNA
jgi:glutamate formiminotransferase